MSGVTREARTLSGADIGRTITLPDGLGGFERDVLRGVEHWDDATYVYSGHSLVASLAPSTPVTIEGTTPMSVLKPHIPTAPIVYGAQVTQANAAAVARELGGAVEPDPKASDPTDIALWLILPTVNGTKRLLVTSEGPAVGKRADNGQTVYWDRAADFHTLYRPQTRTTP